jgi:hypothetical protein
MKQGSSILLHRRPKRPDVGSLQKRDTYLATSFLEIRAVTFREGEILFKKARALFLRPCMEESFPLNIFSTASARHLSVKLLFSVRKIRCLYLYQRDQKNSYLCAQARNKGFGVGVKTLYLVFTPTPNNTTPNNNTPTPNNIIRPQIILYDPK